jgi:hypothetical protein
MPNWVSNTLRVIKGNPKEIFEFVRTKKVRIRLQHPCANAR